MTHIVGNTVYTDVVRVLHIIKLPLCHRATRLHAEFTVIGSTGYDGSITGVAVYGGCVMGLAVYGGSFGSDSIMGVRGSWK